MDHLFDKGGITGGVWSSKGGKTVAHHQHEREVGLRDDEKFDVGPGAENVEHVDNNVAV